MGASVYLCKILCPRPIAKCKLRARSVVAGIEVFAENNERYRDLYKDIAELLSKTDDRDDLEKFDELLRIVNFNDRDSGIVSFSTFDWLASYIENGACTSSDEIDLSVVRTAQVTSTKASAIIDAMRFERIKLQNNIELLGAFSDMSSLPLKIVAGERLVAESSEGWQTVEKPRQLSYTSLLAEAYAFCIAELLACVSLEMDERVKERTEHHLALATDIISSMWHAMEIYSGEVEHDDTAKMR